MGLTPLDIHNKEFTRGFRGYDEDEVNEFLDQVIKDFEKVVREKKQLEERVNEAEEKLNHFSDIEETLNRSILVAQETADEVKNNANKEAKLIIKEAEKNADRIVNDALAKSRQVSMEIEELKKQAKVFRTRLKMLVEAQLDIIDNSDWEDLFEIDTSEEDDQQHLYETTPQGHGYANDSTSDSSY
ncbi:DivIVA domain-containing protein [Alkalibacillus sp. S2W]|uniref:DivIVA domain-containing protein n=1 Tax=Alkalibacillus sp. S2W TaxID=3386553 RepID=UPI00398CF67E